MAPGEGIQINKGGGRFADDLSFSLNIPIKMKYSVLNPFWIRQCLL